MSRATVAVEVDPGGVAAEQHRSARLDHHFGELHRQDARAALDERAARFEIPALRHGEKWPRHDGGGRRRNSRDCPRPRIWPPRRRQRTAEGFQRSTRASPGQDRATSNPARKQLAERSLLARLDQTRDARDGSLPSLREAVRSRPGSSGTGGSAPHARRRSPPADRICRRPGRPSPKRTDRPGPTRSRREGRARSRIACLGSLGSCGSAV